MALRVGISSYVSAGFKNPVRWDIVETGTQVLNDSHTEPGPHGQVYNFDFTNNIKDIVYTILFYDVPGGTGVGNLIKSHDVTVSTSTLLFDGDIETVVDGGTPVDPVSGTSTSPVIDILVGREYYVVQRSIGQLLSTRNVETIFNEDGSYSLADNNKFFPGDTMIIKIRPKYVINPAGSSSGSSVYRDVVLLTADTVIAATDWGKLFIVDGSLPVVTLQLPAATDIPEKISLYVESVGITHINVVLKAALGGLITNSGLASNTFILSRAVKAEVIKLGTTLYGFTDDIDIKRRGQMEWGYSVGINRLWADGTEYLTANYPGLKKALDLMQVGTVVNYAQYDSVSTFNQVAYQPYKGFYALSADGLHFKVPDLRNRFIRALLYSNSISDTQRLTQGAGGLQLPAVEAHAHEEQVFNAVGNGGRKPVGFKDTINNFGPSGYFTALYGGSETRGINIGMVPLIII